VDLSYSEEAVQVGRERLFLYTAWPNATAITKNTSHGPDGGKDWTVQVDGKTWHVDAKRRRIGAARNWRLGVPELPLELTNGTRPGWAVQKSKYTTHFLWTFDDAPMTAFVVGAQPLIDAVNCHLDWRKTYPQFVKESVRDGGTWFSAFMPVPSDVLFATEELQGKYRVLSIAQPFTPEQLRRFR
jgi:hypothetical protein